MAQTSEQKREYNIKYQREYRKRTKYLNRVIQLDESDKEFIRDNIRDMSRSDIARYLGCNITTVIYQAKRMGIYVNITRNRFAYKWNREQAETFMSLYNSGVELSELSTRYNISVPSVPMIAGYIKRKFNIISRRRYTKRACG